MSLLLRRLLELLELLMMRINLRISLKQVVYLVLIFPLFLNFSFKFSHLFYYLKVLIFNYFRLLFLVFIITLICPYTHRKLKGLNMHVVYIQ